MKSRGPSSATDPGLLARLATLVGEERSAATAAAIESAFGREGLATWLALAQELAAATRPARGAVRAFCAVEPSRAARLGLAALERWSRMAIRIAAGSRHLAEVFAETSAPLLGRIDADTLEAWGEAGLALHREPELRRSVLAHGFFATAPAALRLLAPEHFVPWQRLALALGKALEPVEALRVLPPAIGSWSVSERTAWLGAAGTLAARAPRVAATLYRHVPETLAALPPDVRAGLLAVVRAAAEHAPPADVEAVLPLLGVVVPRVPPDHAAIALDLAARTAEVFPAGVPALLRSLGRVLEDASPEHARAWLEQGLAIAAARSEAGLAYLGLESRTSLRCLRASPTAAMLEEVERVLVRVIHMLSGEPALAAAAEGARFRPPLEESVAAITVAFPAAIDAFDTYEDNARLYRVLAAIHAGRRLFATYDAVPGDGDGAARLLAHLHAPERGAAVGEFFLLTDGFRVARRLAASYPGIAADLAWASRGLLGRCTAGELSPAGLLDALLAVALIDTPHHAIPDHAAPGHPLPTEVIAAAALVVPALQPLARPEATAADALALAERLAATLGGLAERLPPLDALANLGAMLLDGGFDAGVPGTEGLSGLPGLPDDEPPPDLVDDVRLLLDDVATDGPPATRALTADELRRLAEAGMALAQGGGAEGAPAGQYVTQLEGKLPPGAEKVPGAASGQPVGAARARVAGEGATIFHYDEWDYLIDDYRARWCQLRELGVGDDAGRFYHQALARHATLVPEIRRHFQRVRAEAYRPLRGLEDGEDFDLNAVVDAHVERRARRPPSSKLYTQRTRQEREVATLFLLDMSASTDETAAGADESRRIIDIAKESLVLMAAALEEIGDAYAIYGFSGQGRGDVQVFPIKVFEERLTIAVKGRIGGIEPKGSTRMGTALRHALGKLRRVSAPARHLVLLSDGFPQDFDYGQDRASHTYGIRDTAVALREAEEGGVRPFCITVDTAGHDYLREMCEESRYLVIENVGDLPRELPKIYQRLVRAAS